MFTVLIADDDRLFTDQLNRRIGMDDDYQVVATLYDGQSAMEQIEQLRPDIVILDIVMPGSDGVYIVDYIRCHIESYRPVIYILSGMGTNCIIKTLNTLDVDFFSLKPVSLDIIMKNLRTIASKLREEAVPAPGLMGSAEPKSRQVESLTMQLGMSPHRKSTRCINDALVYCLENPDGTQLITKILYPTIAKKHGLTSSAVERNIRHAIASIQKAKTPVYEQIFAYSGDKRITNGEFLAVMTEHLAQNQS